MKLAITIVLYALVGLIPKTDNMIELLKNLIEKNEAEKAIVLLEKRPEILDLEDENGSSGLMIIAYSGMGDVLKKAVELKKTFSFYEAIVVGKTENVKGFLDQSVSEICNSRSKDGFSPLSLAAFFNRTEIAKLLVEHGADPNLAATNPSKVNALHSAVARENYELCLLFIEKGVHINATQTQNVTALHSAVHRGNLELTKLLVENGARLDSKMDNGDTPLSIAKKEGHAHIAEYLSTKEN